jgi:hypothetical protein
MKMHVGVEILLHVLSHGLRWRRVFNFTPLPVYPREAATNTHFIGGWMGPRAGFDVVEKRKICYLFPKSNPDS